VPLRLIRPDGTVFAVQSGETLVIGRGPDADLRLEHDGVGAAHARLSTVGDRWRLTDLGEGAVVVNGQTVSQVALKAGDEIRLGGAQLRAEEVRVAAPPPSESDEAPSTEEAARPTAPRRRLAFGPLAWLAAAGLAAWGAFAWTRGDEGAARDAYKAAVEAESRGDYAEAVALYEKVAASSARAALRDEAARRGAAAAASRRKQGEAEGRMSAVIARVGAAPSSQLDAELRAAYLPYVDVVRASAFEARRAELKRAAREASKAFLEQAAREVEALERNGGFGEAARRVREAIASPLVVPDDAAACDALVAHADAAARESAAKLIAACADLDPAERARRLNAASALYAGSAGEAPLKARIAEDALAANATPAPAPGGDAAPEAPVGRPAEDAATAGDAALVARDFARAAEEYESAAAAGGPDAERLRARADRCRRIAGFKERLTETLNAEKAKLRGISFGRDLTGSLTAADARQIEFDVGGGARVRWTWARLDADRFTAILARLALPPEDERALAEWWLEVKRPDAALAALARAAARDASWPARQTHLVAEARGMPAPEGGFTLYDGRFLTRVEEEEARLAAAIDAASTELAAAPYGAFGGAAVKLRGLGARGEEALKRGLQARSEANLRKVEELPAVKGGALEPARAALFQELETRRKAALDLVFDEARYPYPYGPNQEQVQAEVDRLIEAVREVWSTPSRLFVKPGTEAANLADDQRAVAATAREFGLELPAEGVFAAIDRRLAVHEFGPDAKTRSILEDSKEIERWNAGRTEVIGEFEREVHRLTNAYRLMMGRRAVMIDDKLVLAARGHSEEMSRLKYFAHESPTAGRRSPGDRARLAGWGGSVSENIARGAGTPEGAVLGWIRSSGHHRNLLGGGWTHLGVGYAEDGNFWTQNFGRGATKPPRDGK